MAAREEADGGPTLSHMKNASLTSSTFFWVLELFSFLGEKRFLDFFFYLKFQTEIKKGEH